jgi:hypothetical protein
MTTRKTSNENANVDARANFAKTLTNASKTNETNAKTIVHTNDTKTYQTMRSNAQTKSNVRFDHKTCNHRNDKNDRAKCRKLMQSNATTFVYVETNANDANAK